MSDIDPELQHRLNGIVLGFVTACNRIRESATNAALSALDLSFELDSKVRQKSDEIASHVIKTAKK